MGCNLIAECEGSGITATIYVKGKSPCPYCRKTHIDLAYIVEWQTQFDLRWGDRPSQEKACFKTCELILKNVGLTYDANNAYKIAEEDKNVGVADRKEHKYLRIDLNKAEEGLAYIDEQLEQNRPVLVGVDYHFGSPNTDEVTDHFVVIIGRHCDCEDGGESFYYFYEVGTGQRDLGTSDENRLYLKGDNTLRGTPKYETSRKYVVNRVMKNILL